MSFYCDYNHNKLNTRTIIKPNFPCSSQNYDDLMEIFNNLGVDIPIRILYQNPDGTQYWEHDYLKRLYVTQINTSSVVEIISYINGTPCYIDVVPGEYNFTQLCPITPSTAPPQ